MLQGKEECVFVDRKQAGAMLAQRLLHLAAEQPIVLGLPRGGVPVAAEVAAALHAPLDVCVVRKIGVPWQPEYGVGAVAEGGEVFLDARGMAAARVTERDIAPVIARERREVEARVRRFRPGQSPLDVQGRTVIVVDDGLATGGTAHAALRALRHRGAAKLILAVPVGAADSLAALRDDVDEIVTLATPSPFIAVGHHYGDFHQVKDSAVVQQLCAARQRQPTKQS